MSKLPALISGMGLGAVTIYFLDPDRGARRRAMLRDQAVRLGHGLEDFLGKARRDLQYRGEGIVAETRQRLRPDGDVDDEVLAERVRAKMGRYVSHPSAIEVMADQGWVTLKGLILSDELDAFVAAVSKVPGVSEVVNQLEPHDRGENIPALQGGVPPPGEPAEWAQASWTPGLQLLAGVASGVAAIYGAQLIVKGRARRTTPGTSDGN